MLVDAYIGLAVVLIIILGFGTFLLLLLSSSFLFYFIQLTYADILFFDFFNNFLGKGKPEDPEHFSKFPKLEEHYKQVRDFPGIKTWLEKRPKTDL